MTGLARIERRGTWVWPTSDTQAWFWLHAEKELPQIILRHVKKRDMCLHAGANVGFYARQYAKEFSAVWAFEPEATNFACLCRNVPDANVIKMQMALGLEANAIDMIGVEENIGAHLVNGAGIVPMINIDSLRMRALDLLHLDVEGHERFVLDGARETILHFKPVIALETIPANLQRSGDTIASITARLAELGYRVAETLRYDTIFVPDDDAAGD